MRYSIDRIEDNVAVCQDEDGNIKEISPPPTGAKEGSVIIIGDDGSIIFDVCEEEKRREAMFNLQNSLFDE